MQEFLEMKNFVHENFSIVPFIKKKAYVSAEIFRLKTTCVEPEKTPTELFLPTIAH